MGFWKVVLQGPPGSPYGPGTFLLYVDIGPQYPRLPPDVRFITNILHPNISKHGRVCHPIFDREWDSGIHVRNVLEQIYGILMSLESRDVVDPLATLTFYTNPVEGRRQVQEYITRFALKSRQEYRAEILDDVSDTSSVISHSTVASESTTTSSRTAVSNASAATARPGSLGSLLSSMRRPPPLIGNSRSAAAGSTTSGLTEANVAALDSRAGGGSGARSRRSGGRREDFFRMLGRANRRSEN